MNANHARPARRVSGLVAAGAFALLAAGCTVKPDPIMPGEHVWRAQDDYKKIYKDYQPVEKPLTLADAVARALKYNYDAELSRQQATLQERQLDMAMAAMLPRLAVNVGYTHRSNDPAAQSVNVRSRQVTLDHAFSEQPYHWTAGPEFTWTVLDIGLSYFQAKQQGYLTFAAVERRRKTIGDIVKRVQDAYWRAEAANKILPRLGPLLKRAEDVLEQSRQAAKRGLSADLPQLEFQREMTQVVGQLRHIDTNLNNAKAQLATLINVPTDAKMAFSGGDWALKKATGKIDTRYLEELGLALRPELREEAYQEKVDRQDVYKEIIKMLPGVGVLANINFDSNRYLYNQTWGSIGVQASFNLSNLIRGPRALAAAEQAVEVSKTRRLALSVAVLSQINLALQQYTGALDDLRTAEDLWNIEKRIARVSSNAAEAASLPAAEKVRRELGATLAELNYYQSVAGVRLALAGLYLSCGVDLVPPTLDLTDIGTMTRDVAEAVAPWVTGQPPNVALPEPIPPEK